MRFNLVGYIYLLLSFYGNGQGIQNNFKHLSLEDGLSQSSVAPIIKDSEGFMWFGTEDGLNRYDGSNFKVYRHQPNDKESLSNSYILSIMEEKDGFLWVGTKNGLNYFNPNTEKFQRFLQNSKNSKNSGSQSITSLEKDADGNLLVGTGNGLYKYDATLGFIPILPSNSNEPYHVVSTAKDKEGNLWVHTTETLEKLNYKNGRFSEPIIQMSFEKSFDGDLLFDEQYLWVATDKGITKFNTKTKASKKFNFFGLQNSIKGSTKIFCVRKATNEKLWLGSIGNGLILFDKKTGSFQNYVHDLNNRRSLSSNAVGSVFQDETGILWVGTISGGINKYDPNQTKFEHFKKEPGNENSLSDNSVRALLRDRDGDLWVGTHKGLNRIDASSGNNIVYTSTLGKPSTISSNVVRSLAEDSDGTIWIGTWDHGLNSFDKKSGIFKRYYTLPGQKDSINHVPALTTDIHGNLWVGANGLWKYDPRTKQSKRYLTHKKGNHQYYIRSLCFDKKSILWIGTNENGLLRLDTSSGAFTQFLHDPAEPKSLANNSVVSLALDKQGYLWSGTYGGGLNIFDPSNESFKHYDTRNGLVNDVIYGILIDLQGFVWFTSNAGLCRFDSKNEVFNYFGTEYGIQSEEFNAGAYYQSDSGEFFFGGINGYNAFYPLSIKKETKTEKIVFTSFELPDDRNNLDLNTFLDKNISRAERISLPYNRNTITIKFAELNYSNNLDHNYEYQLLGNDEQWHNLGRKQNITLSGLNPGSSTLWVRAHNDSTQGASIKIAVSPPLWRTNWAYAAYLLAVVLVGTFFFRNRRRFEQRRREFELKITNWENENGSTVTPKSTLAISLQEKDEEVVSMDQKFLDRAIQIVEENIGDSSFDVEKFKDEMFMSRSKLHRKLKSATGNSTTEFIRLIRLKRAAQLLKGNTGTVTEIAYKVGFENVGYFSKCFSETFGVPPSQYNP
ncbi:helix-turn-helix domain-containing protein [Maribacter algarum]|uniref:Helix-turn-helix domain-containing protein n=1 Tax=Maribacter algarum (ex Zhang et al. 2020) TaxID=2578118 RepID=A0A5S3PPP1_9FLAO|nr:two-component regulator propeller domain-containing protein [Maribacter algarum]TMM56641.1 helix-turn-helix domain-containing protein [Maribacter algarum]